MTAAARSPAALLASSAMVDDADLLARWRGGDRAAGEQLFDRYFKALARFFRNKGADRMDDLIQQTMLGLLEASAGFRAEGSFRSFVFGVAYNVLRNHYRSQRRDDAHLDFGATSVFDLAPGAADLIAQAQEQRLLLQGLRRIPLEHQVLLELYFWEPLGAAEIAVALGVPEGTVRTRIRRAKALLQQAVAQLCADPALVESTISNLDDWARALRGHGARGSSGRADA